MAKRLSGSIYLAKFPYSEEDGAKFRPVLVVSEPRGEYELVVIAYISSRFPKEFLDTDVIIDNDWQVLGLKTPSVIRLHKLTNLPVDHLPRLLGKLSNSSFTSVKQRLGDIFSLGQ
ncbi:hypothetical protein COY17_02675 [Candidatus Saccharibacteria bacterium CG_4_10_14_0_2_um_filter_52_9]|nr:MAG: hypothetical protein COY17_02675 [Candidatus Saccharibacteria bacterium CG_4_10_14_0_2_um_filter_52_9]